MTVSIFHVQTICTNVVAPDGGFGPSASRRARIFSQRPSSSRDSRLSSTHTWAAIRSAVTRELTFRTRNVRLVTEITKCPGPAAVYVEGTRVRRWIYTCVYIAATRKWDCGGATRWREKDGAEQGWLTSEREEGAERGEKNKTTCVPREAADTGETRVKDEDAGVARASLARILISSTAHQPLAESRSFAHFIFRSAKRGLGRHGGIYARRRLRQIGKLRSLTLLPGRRPPSRVSLMLLRSSSSRKRAASIVADAKPRA